MGCGVVGASRCVVHERELGASRAARLAPKKKFKNLDIHPHSEDRFPIQPWVRWLLRCKVASLKGYDLLLMLIGALCVIAESSLSGRIIAPSLQGALDWIVKIQQAVISSNFFELST